VYPDAQVVEERGYQIPFFLGEAPWPRRIESRSALGDVPQRAAGHADQQRLRDRPRRVCHQLRLPVKAGDPVLAILLDLGQQPGRVMSDRIIDAGPR
jgi:hypothetical protein